MGSTSRRYTPELMERAVRLVLETIEQDGEEFGVITRIAHQLDIDGSRCGSGCVERRSTPATGRARPGRTTLGSASSQREVREVRRSNSILRSASAFFAAELDRPRR